MATAVNTGIQSGRGKNWSKSASRQLNHSTHGTEKLTIRLADLLRFVRRQASQYQAKGFIGDSIYGTRDVDLYQLQAGALNINLVI